MKKLTALVLTLTMIFLLAAMGGSAAFADNEANAADEEMAYLAGHWGEIEWIRNGDNNPFYLDNTVTDATWVQFTMTVPVSPRGYPYGDWYLYTLDKDGKTWGHVAKFSLDKDMTAGKPVTIRLALDAPTTFKAITITSVDSGMDFTLWRLIDFYTDPACIPKEAQGAEPASLEDQLAAYAGKQLPLTRQAVSYAPYSDPGRAPSEPGGYYPDDNYYPNIYYPATVITPADSTYGTAAGDGVPTARG